MTCDKCHWLRKFLCVSHCAGMIEEFNRMDMEIIERWEREYLHKETK